jgi:hypothetical protein
MPPVSQFPELPSRVLRLLLAQSKPALPEGVQPLLRLVWLYLPRLQKVQAA